MRSTRWLVSYLGALQALDTMRALGLTRAVAEQERYVAWLRSKAPRRGRIGPCPRCGGAGEHPRNYGRPQRDRGWCRECGSLWTITTEGENR